MEETETVDVIGLTRELYDYKEKYERLKESHRKLLSVNQNLEDKILSSINNYETEKYSLMHTISRLNFQVDELERVNQKLVSENERFKMDISVAIQLLHCKPSSFSSCKLRNLPPEFQSKAKNHMQQDPFPKFQPEKKGKVIRVPISAFPSTTVIYSIPSEETDEEDGIRSEVTVPPETMAKVLEERQQELYPQVLNGSRLTTSCSNTLHTSHSMSFLDGLQYVDHGTQTYPNFIGEREKTVKTCIFCQGSQPNRCPESVKSESTLPLEDPKVFLYTETEVSPLSMRTSLNTSRKAAAKAHRRKIQTTSSNGNVSSRSKETDI